MDEAHHFLLAKDSNSISELYKNAAYEGHPLLWNCLLFVITHFSSDVFYMQLLNITIMATCIYLFLRHAPFKKLFSVLIVFGYFFIYEYNIISRNYAISLLCLTLVFIQLNKPTKNHLLLAAYLILLSFTHIYSIIVVVALCCVLLYQNKTSNTKYIYAGIVVFAFLLIYSLQVPSDHILFKFDTDPFLSYKRIGKASTIFLKGFLPIPVLKPYSAWNSNLIISSSQILGSLLCIVCAIIPFFIFRKYRLVLFFFYASTLTIGAFIYISPLIVSVRYCGFIFIILLFSFWLKKILYPNEQEYPSSYKKIAIAILAIHILSGIYLFVTDLNHPFSNAKALAAFIKEKKLEDKAIYLSNLSTGPAVVAYLNKKITYLETEEKKSFCNWNTWPFILTMNQINEKLRRLAKKDTSLFILSTPYHQGNLETLGQSSDGDLTLIKLISFEKAIVNSENYTVYYLIKRHKN